MAVRSNQPAGKVEAAAMRRVQALELRKSGASYRAIATRLGISPRQAYNDVQRALAAVSELEASEATALRTLETERLDALLLAVMPKALKGELVAVDRALRVLESRRKLLGLDAPAKVAPTTPDGEDAYLPLPNLSEIPSDELRDFLRRYRADGPGG